jgi:hypothetical protein
MDPTDDNFDFYAFYQQQQQEQEQYNHERDIQMAQFGNNANGVGLANTFTPDTYYCSQCLDPSGNQPVWHVYSSRCNGCRNSVASSADATQRRIQNTVRVSQSEYLENLAGLNVYTPAVARAATARNRAECSATCPATARTPRKRRSRDCVPGPARRRAKAWTLSTGRTRGTWRASRGADRIARKPCPLPPWKATKPRSTALRRAIATITARVRCMPNYFLRPWYNINPLTMNASIVQLTDPHAMGGWFAPFTNRQYCAWFFWLMVVSAVGLVFHVAAALIKVVSSGGKLYPITSPMFWSMFVMNGLGYFTNRLLYTMCLNSV